MSIPYRTRRVINRVGTVFLTILLIGAVAWLCWVVWLERYVVYTEDGATLDFSLSSQEVSGEVANPPVAEENISIYYNEGSDALNTSSDMTQLNGYYITSEMLQTELAGVNEKVDKLVSGTPIMIDMKGPYGSFFYPSHLDEALHSASTDVEAVGELVTKLQNKGFYTIARVSAFQDYNFGLNHVSSGLYMLSRAGLWMDDEGFYWLDPTNATTINWITNIIAELKEMGFQEVMLTNFRFPVSDQYIFDGDKDTALQEAAQKLVSATNASGFTLSFGVDNAAFALPEGRCRIYLEGVDASRAETLASQTTVEDKQIQLVFVAETNDTRFNEYSVLRSLNVADVLEAQKADASNG